MSKLKPSNPYAFPCEKDEPGKGMTLRDYFAAKAMQSVLSNQTFLEAVLQEAQIGIPASEAVSRTAFVMADAMLKQRQI